VPYGMVSTSTSNIYKVFECFHMLWMGRWIHNHAISTVVVGPELEFRTLADIEGHIAGLQMMSVVEAPVPYGMVSTSTSNICKVFDNFHMLWMRR
jgi:hypothetical protein